LMRGRAGGTCRCCSPGWSGISRSSPRALARVPRQAPLRPKLALEPALFSVHLRMLGTYPAGPVRAQIAEPAQNVSCARPPGQRRLTVRTTEPGPSWPSPARRADWLTPSSNDHGSADLARGKGLRPPHQPLRSPTTWVLEVIGQRGTPDWLRGVPAHHSIHRSHRMHRPLGARCPPR
jgi:hypothetical protein